MKTAEEVLEFIKSAKEISSNFEDFIRTVSPLWTDLEGKLPARAYERTREGMEKIMRMSWEEHQNSMENRQNN